MGILDSKSAIRLSDLSRARHRAWICPPSFATCVSDSAFATPQNNFRNDRTGAFDRSQNRLHSPSIQRAEPNIVFVALVPATSTASAASSSAVVVRPVQDNLPNLNLQFRNSNAPLSANSNASIFDDLSRTLPSGATSTTPAKGALPSVASTANDASVANQNRINYSSTANYAPVNTYQPFATAPLANRSGVSTTPSSLDPIKSSVASQQEGVIDFGPLARAIRFERRSLNQKEHGS